MIKWQNISSTSCPPHKLHVVGAGAQLSLNGPRHIPLLPIPFYFFLCLPPHPGFLSPKFSAILFYNGMYSKGYPSRIKSNNLY